MSPLEKRQQDRLDGQSEVRAVVIAFLLAFGLPFGFIALLFSLKG